MRGLMSYPLGYAGASPKALLRRAVGTDSQLIRVPLVEKFHYLRFPLPFVFSAVS